MFCFSRCAFDDEGMSTTTSREQLKTEEIVAKTFELWQSKLQHEPQNISKIINRPDHVRWLMNAMRTLPAHFLAFTCTHPWVVFWTIQSLALLDITPIPGVESLTTSLSSTTTHQMSPELATTSSHPPSPSPSSSFDSSTSAFPSTIKPSLSSLDSGIWTHEFGTSLIDFLCRFQHPIFGGFAGQFGGEPHILTTYAAVMSIIITGTRCGVLDYAYNSINTVTLRGFFLSMKISDPIDTNFGSFQTCSQGEVDTRAIYCALATLDILGMLPDDELTANLVQWLTRCQNYDGGFSAEPGVESHGGYTFTALAALLILEQPSTIKLDLLEKWCVTKQMEKEGGFCGRTHKLVDSCYSYWVGVTIPLVHIARDQIKYINTFTLSQQQQQEQQQQEQQQQGQCTPNGADITSNVEIGHIGPSEIESQNISPCNNKPSEADSVSNIYTLDNFSTLFASSPYHNNNLSAQCDTVIDIPTELGWVFDQQALQSYIALVCQDKFGFKDKPGKHCDLYHTCYSLSGLAVAQSSIPYGKASYIYHQHPFTTPSPSTTTACQIDLTVVSVTPQPNHQNGFDNINSSSTPTPLYDTQTTHTPTSTPVKGYNYKLPLLLSTQERIESYKQPAIFRLGGQYAKLHQNNPIYNIPQRCYLLAHAYIQSRKQNNQ